MADEIRVLHVDDDPAFSELAATFLERIDDRFEVHTAADALVGRERLADERFDCVVSDFDMPDMDGIEFLATVRKTDPDLPFILYTGRGSEEVASRAISLGVTDYLQKDGGNEQYEVLANRIENVVEQARYARRAEEQARKLGILREINEALLRADTVEEIERVVVDILAADAGYAFVWFGAYDPEHDRILPHAVAGVPDDAVGPTAVRDRSLTPLDDGIEVTVATPGSFARGAWDDDPPAPYAAVAIVPIVYDAHRYGFLALHAHEAETIDEDERRMLAEIAGDTAQAYHGAVVRDRLRQHRTAVEAVPEGIFLLDAEGTIDLLNDSACEFFGLPREDVVGTPFPTYVDQGMFDASIMEWYVESVREMLSSGSDRHEARYEAEVTAVDGDTRVIEVHLTLRPYEERYRGTVGIVRDVTDRRQREMTLERTRRRFEAMFDDPVTMVAIADADGRLVRVNSTARQLLGQAEDDLLGTLLWDIPETLDDRLQACTRRALDGEAVVGDIDLDIDGEERQLVGSFRPIPEGEDEAILITWRVLDVELSEVSPDHAQSVVPGVPDDIEDE